MKLERHVGGLSIERKVSYLLKRGWRRHQGAWLSSVPVTDPVSMKWAVHHQLTQDLATGLAGFGWSIVEYSPRGYVRLEDPIGHEGCSLPEALRRQARREKRPVRELTRSLFLAAGG